MQYQLSLHTLRAYGNDAHQKKPLEKRIWVMFGFSLLIIANCSCNLNHILWGEKKIVVAPSHENSDFILHFKKRKHTAKVEMKKLMKPISH